MKLAHLILAHKNPAMLERLVRRLQNDEADIFIHLDKKTNIDAFKHLEDIGNVWFITHRVTTGWGNYSIIQATLNGLEHILQTGVMYSHINLLSGQDYPIKPIGDIQQFLFANSDKTFTRNVPIPDDWTDGQDRFLKYNLGDYKLKGRYKLQLIANTILPNRKIPGNLKPYGGSQWLSITPECAQYCIDHIKNNSRLRRFFRMTWAVDEVFFQTILANSPLRNQLVNDNLRYIVDGADKRPVIFTVADADKLTSAPGLFARKFDTTVDTAILDYLDTIIGKPVAII